MVRLRSFFSKRDKGLGSIEYAIVFFVFVLIAIGFAAFSTGILRQGIDIVTTDLSTSDSLSRSVGVVQVAPPVRELALLPALLPHAIYNTVYSVDFKVFVDGPRDLDPLSLVFTLVDGTLPTGLSLSSTGVLTGIHEELGAVQVLPLTVQVTDGVDVTTQAYELVVRQPGLGLLPGSLPTASSGNSYVADLGSFVLYPAGVTAEDISWSITSGTLPSGLIFNPSLGRFEGTYVGLENVTSLVTVQITGGGYTAFQNFTVQANGTGLELSDAGPYNWVYNEPVSIDFSSLLSVSSAIDQQALSWTIRVLDSNNQPVTLDGIAVVGSTISGTPLSLTSGAFGVEVEVTQGIYSARRVYEMAYTGPPLLLSNQALPNVRANNFYDFDMDLRLTVGPGIDRSLVSWSVSGGGLVSGLALNPVTGVISGTHSGLDDLTMNVTIRATLPDARFVEQAYTVPVIGAGAVAIPQTLPPALYGVPYEFDFKDTLTTRNPFDFNTLGWTFSGSSLPSGLSFNTVEGLMSGTHFAVEDSTLLLLVIASDAENVTATAIHNFPVDGLAPFSASTGESMTCLLDEIGRPWCAGLATSGQLGNGATQPQGIFTKINMGSSGGEFVQLEIAGNRACGVQRDGDVWCWGEGSLGQLGHGLESDSAVPVLVESSQMGNVTKIALGPEHGCGINVDGEVWCWGNEQNGRLGNAQINGEQAAPIKVIDTTMDKAIIDITAGEAFTCAVDVDGGVWCWGLGSSGQLGTGSAGSESSPVAVAAPVDFGPVSNIAAGTTHVCAVETGSVWCWGAAGSGQLGAVYGSDQSTPRLVPATLMGPLVEEVEAGDRFSCGRTAGEKVWCWGLNNNGQLGNGTVQSSSAPVEATSLVFDTLWGLDIGSSADHACAWTMEREIVCWGNAQSAKFANTSISNPPSANYDDIFISTTNPSAGMGNWVGNFTTRVGSPYATGYTYYFAGAGVSRRSEINVAIPAQHQAAIDAGLLNVNLDWNQGSFDSRDHGGMEIIFKNGGGTTISTLTAPSIPGSRDQYWLDRRLAGNIPVGTRTMTFAMFATEVNGTNNDVYIDSIRMKVSHDDDTLDSVSIPLVNPNAVDGVTGWTVSAGVSTRPHLSVQVFDSNGVASSTAHQTVAIPTQLRAAVDAGVATGRVTWDQSSFDDSDPGAMRIEYFDANNVSLGVHTSQTAPSESDIFTPRMFEVAVPSAARSIRVTMVMTRVSGANADAYMRNIQLSLLVPPALPYYASPLGLVIPAVAAP